MKSFLRQGNGKKRIFSCAVVLAALAFMLIYAKGQESVKGQYQRDFESMQEGNSKEASFAIGSLKINWIENAVGVDETTPSFSWEIIAEKSGFKQKAYRICVWDVTDVSYELVWDSNTVFSGQSNNISYQGEPLQSHKEYHWQVTVWNEQQEVAASTIAGFTTAYVGELPFGQAKMISMQGEENVYDEGQAVFIKEFQLPYGKQIKKATLYASALGIYDAWINGKRVGQDELKPGWSNYHKSLYYNTYDITNLIGGSYKEEESLQEITEGAGLEIEQETRRETVVEAGWQTETDTKQDAVEAVGEETKHETVEAVEQEAKQNTAKGRKQQNNRIAVMLGTGWWCGRVAFGTYDYHKPGFICTIRLEYDDGSVEEIHTDESWKYVKDTAVVSADIFNGEVYDGSKLTTRQLSEKEISEGVEQKPVVVNVDFNGTFRSLCGYPVQNVESYDQKPKEFIRYDSVHENGTTYGEIAVKEKSNYHQNLLIKKGETVIFDMGQNMTGVPWVKYQAKEGTKITLDFAEMLNDSGAKKRGNDGPKGSLYTANYRSAVSELTLVAGASKTEEYQPVFTYYGFRYISITATDDMVLIDITGKFIGNSSPETGYIETDNELVNQLYRNITWTQRNNFLSVATDCPQRDERIGWMGDLQVFAKTSMYNQNLASFYDKWFEDVADSQTEEGAYTDTVPATMITGAGNAGWADAGISVPYDYYKMYGDSKQLLTSYPSMKKYMEYLESISNFDLEQGRVGPLTTYGDWLGVEDSDKELISALYYAKDAMQMEEIAGVLKKDKDAGTYNKLYEKVKKYFRDKYMCEGEIKEEYRTQTVLVLAVAYDMLSQDEKEVALQQLSEKVELAGGTLSTGFLGTPVILKALSENGKLAEAYQLLLQEKNPSWIYSILQGATTIWERYDSYTMDNGFADVAMNSFNHFNNGSVAQWMYENMLGIQMVQEDTYSLLLCPGIILDNNKAPMHEVEGSYHSVYGRVYVSFQIAKEQVVYQVEIPANCQGKLQLPVYDTQKEIKQTTIKESKQIYKEWNLGSGTYKFVYDRAMNQWNCSSF